MDGKGKRGRSNEGGDGVCEAGEGKSGGRAGTGVEVARVKGGLPRELARLDTVVGLGSVKEHLRGIHAQLLMDRRRRDAGLACASHGSLHMIFTGNPGTGKVRLASSYSLVCRVSHKSDCFAACLIQNIPLYHEWCL